MRHEFNDDAFCYIKMVTVTPAVYPRLLTLTSRALSRNHIASTPFETIAMLCFKYTFGFHVAAPVLNWLFTAQGPTSEPIVFQKLRINVADVPHLLCPMGQRLPALESDAVMGTSKGREYTFPVV